MEGVKVPNTIKNLSKTKEITAFLDGDRGGDLILQELMQVAPPTYITRAPRGKEVEELTPEEIWTIAERCNNMERLFNLREGLARDDLMKGDMLNHRYFDEPCTRGAPDVIGLTIDREKVVKMVDEFYEHHGWDKSGVPLPKTLKRLGIDKEPSHLL